MHWVNYTHNQVFIVKWTYCTYDDTYLMYKNFYVYEFVLFKLFQKLKGRPF